MIEVYVDGASAGNPGLSGAGIFIKLSNGTVERYPVPLGMMTNHEAEYHAFIKALEICVEKGYVTASFRTDSQLIDQAVEKRYVKKASYNELLQNALELIDQFELFFIKWIPSSQNKTADELARKAVLLNKK
jgi:ribonuclease HI